MDLEFHQVDLRYEALRTRSAPREARLLASLAENGQQAPVVVVTVGDGGSARARGRLQARAGAAPTRARHGPGDGLGPGRGGGAVLERLMRSGDGAGALEEGWLLAELRDRFGMTVEELGRRFDRSASWVSRRLGLVGELPREIQEQVRRGEIAAHAAMQHLVPLARANTAECGRSSPRRSARTGRRAGRSGRCARRGSRGARRRASSCIEDPRLFLRAPGAGAARRRSGRGTARPRCCSRTWARSAASRAARSAACARGSSPGCWRPSARSRPRARPGPRRRASASPRPTRRRRAMLDETTRAAILRLRLRGTGRAHRDARSASRGTRCARCSATAAPTVPHLERAEQGDAAPRARSRALYIDCKGNLVRVHEELAAHGATLSYPALTAFCRRHGIGHAPPAPVGHYDFAPGQEMQHDTSPHDAQIAGSSSGASRPPPSCSATRGCSSSSAIRASRRFECKVFLTDALAYFGGAARRCMIDNTHVVVLRGTGRDMVPGAGDGGLRRTLRLRLRRARKGRRQPLGPRRAPVRLHRAQFPRRPRLRRPRPTSIPRRAPGATRSTPRIKRHLHATPARALRRRATARCGRCPLWVPEVYAAPPPHRRRRGLRHVDGSPLLGAVAAHRAPASRCARRRTAIEVFDGPRASPRTRSRARGRRQRASRCPSIVRRAARAAPRVARRRPRRRELAAAPARRSPTTSPRSSSAPPAAARSRCAGSCAMLARVSARRRCSTRDRARRALRPLRPRSPRAHGPARHRQRLLPAVTLDGEEHDDEAMSSQQLLEEPAPRARSPRSSTRSWRSAPRRRTCRTRSSCARLLRAQWQHRPGDRARLAHQAAPGSPSSGRSSPFPSSASPASTQRQIRTFAELDFVAQGREHRLHRPDRRRQDRTRLGAAAQGAAERPPRRLHARAGSLRRDVRLARRPLDRAAPQPPRPRRRPRD